MPPKHVQAQPETENAHEPGIPDMSDILDKPETRLREDDKPSATQAPADARLQHSGFSKAYVATWILGIVLSSLLWLVAENLVAQRLADQSLLRQYTAQKIIRDEITRVDRDFTVMAGLLNPETGMLPGNAEVILTALDPEIAQFYRMRRIQGANWSYEPMVPVSAERQALLDTMVFSPGGEVNRKIISYLPSKLHKFFVIPVPNMPRKTVSNNSVQREAMSFVMGRRVSATNTGTGDDIFVIVTTWPDMLGANYLAKMGAVQGIEIVLPKENMVLLKEKQSYSPTALSKLLPDSWQTQNEILLHEIGNQQLKTNLTFVTSDAELLLHILPYVLMLIGLGVTWLVADNIYQHKARARELRAMNRKLSQRNMELQNQSREAQKLEATINRSQMNSLAIINAVHEIIFEVDGHGHFSFLNKPWQRITGYTPEQCTGKSLFDYLSPDERDEHLQQFTLLVQGQKPVFTTLAQLQTASGDLHPIELVYSMLRQDHNRELRVIGIMNSISEKLEAEGRAAENEKQFRSLWESAPIGMYQMSAQGKYLQVNPAMLNVLGFESTEELQRRVRQTHNDLYLNPRDRLQFLQSLMIDDATAGEAEFELRRKDGSTLWVAETVRVIRDEKGAIKFYEGTMNDITDTRTANMALQKAIRESDIANRAKTEFLSNIGHELRTPLNSIIGFSEIIRHQALGPIENPNYVEYAGEILDSGKRLLKVINQILDIARIDARERQLNEGIVRIPSVVNSCLDLLRSKIDEKRLLIINMIPADLPDIIGEELAIRQIMFNLVSNAVKFTRDGGQITIAHNIDPVQGCRISVSDTGLGLDEEEITRALTPFGMVEHGHARENYGIGLGLTMAKMLINLHQGDLDIFSQKGVGTTVSIIIPPTRVRERATRLAPSFDAGKVEQTAPNVVTLKTLASSTDELPDAPKPETPEIFSGKPTAKDDDEKPAAKKAGKGKKKKDSEGA